MILYKTILFPTDCYATLIHDPAPMRPFATQGVKGSDIAAGIPPHVYPVVCSLLDPPPALVLYTHVHKIRYADWTRLRFTIISLPNFPPLPQMPQHPAPDQAKKKIHMIIPGSKRHCC